ncbi:restriction endonuclease subunit S [uncultured Clostridium sp.]|uniref:restriction endonuclease subunit S n=1 Tax=uncultured Clostridium sp. TaxID=59620 RepID=UPI00280B7C8F|nr:restriction endonuclease subunit S [uncultured Clostridium sp.]
MVGNEKIKLGCLLEKNISKKSISENELVSFIPMESVSENGMITDNKIIQYKDVKKGLTYFEKDDVLVAKITPCFENGKGACLDNLPTIKGFGSTEFHVLRANRDSISRYVFYQTQLNSFRKRLEREMVGSAGQKRVQLSVIENYELKVKHSKEEQKAIAKALSDIDDLILSLEKLINKKKLIKEGAMEELLTGKKRLDGFNEEWICCKICDLATNIYSGGTPLTNVSKYYGGNIKWITSSDLNRKMITNVEGRITEEGLKHSSAKMVKKNTLLIALYGATAGIAAITKIDAAINQAVLAIDTDMRGTREFMFQWMQFKKDWIIKTYTQGGQPNLSGDIVKNIEIMLPIDFNEREEISTILSDMDKEIEKLEKKLDKYKSIKNGMMEELLTGKRRIV